MGLRFHGRWIAAFVIGPVLLVGVAKEIIETYPRSDDDDYIAVFRVLNWVDGDRPCNDRTSIIDPLPSSAAMCKPIPGGRGAFLVSAISGYVLRKSTAPLISELKIACLDGRKVVVGSQTGHVFEVEDGVITDFFRLPNDEMGRIENAIEEWESGDCNTHE